MVTPCASMAVTVPVIVSDPAPRSPPRKPPWPGTKLAPGAKLPCGPLAAPTNPPLRNPLPLVVAAAAGAVDRPTANATPPMAIPSATTSKTLSQRPPVPRDGVGGVAGVGVDVDGS